MSNLPMTDRIVVSAVYQRAGSDSYLVTVRRQGEGTDVVANHPFQTYEEAETFRQEVSF